MKPTLLALLALLTTLTLTTPAAAADWAGVTSDGEFEFVIGVDPASLRDEGGHRVGELIFAYRLAHASGALSYDYAIREVEIDCAGHKHGLRVTSLYRLGTAAPVLVHKETGTALAPVEPDSMGWDVLQTFCGGAPMGPVISDDAGRFASLGRQVLQEHYDKAAAAAH